MIFSNSVQGKMSTYVKTCGMLHHNLYCNWEMFKDSWRQLTPLKEKQTVNTHRIYIKHSTLLAGLRILHCRYNYM